MVADQGRVELSPLGCDRRRDAEALLLGQLRGKFEPVWLVAWFEQRVLSDQTGLVSSVGVRMG
jgi:hypothetical protein